jgi:hypothetical protein
MLPMISQGFGARVRTQPGEFAGYAVLHCHSLQHEDEGCMKVGSAGAPPAFHRAVPLPSPAAPPAR